MDDPWGSPWADESPRPLPKLNNPVSKRPVTPEKALSAGQGSKSPWDDDDGFGEWATLPATDEVQANEQDGPEQAEITEWDASVNEKYTQGKDHIRPDGSAWFRREIQHTGAGILGLEIPQVAGRALSPDPWAENAAKAEETTRTPPVPESNAGEESTTNGTDEHGALSLSGVVKDEDGNCSEAIDEVDNAIPPNDDKAASIGRTSNNHNQDKPPAVLNDAVTDRQTGEVNQGDSLASRPSSSPSDHSHHDEVLTDSPRTSFEEEDKRPKIDIEGPSKVKETVPFFDGLAGDEDRIDPPGYQGGADVGDDCFDTPVAPQSEDDFGDFEGGTSCVTTKADPIEDVLTEQERKSQNKAANRTISDLPSSIEEPTINPSDQLTKPPDPVHFDLDLSLLSHMLGQIPWAESEHADPSQAPETDSVIQDSFSSTDERKTWYRISRYSTMRKHNAGDEDNYTRVNWKGSGSRAETLKIVERWIEEDRLGGGVILGGGTQFGSMFGWGQKNSVPMSVAAALASRRGRIVTHSDHTASPISTGNSDASPMPESGSSHKSLEQISRSRDSFQSPVLATGPKFSWSTGTPTSATAESTMPVLSPLMSPVSDLRHFSNSSSLPNVVKESSSRKPSESEGTSVISESFSAQRAKQVAENVPGLQKVLEPPENVLRLEAGDDWGEMISSPALENPAPVTEALMAKTNSGAMDDLSPSLGINSSAMSLDHTSEGHLNDRMTAPQSKDGVFLVPSLEDHSIKPEFTSSTALNSDAWATADFSFFDIPAPPKQTPAPPASTPRAPIPAPISAKKNQGASGEQAEQDRIVKSIVQNLPDLSYMLRR